MDNLISFTPSEFGTHFYFIIVAVVVLATLYIHDMWNGGCHSIMFDNGSYGYNDFNGPSTWKCRYVSAGGSKQSPINLQDNVAFSIAHETVPSLTFSPAFHLVPCEMKLYNNGHNIVIYATWLEGKRPYIYGGPLDDKYKFLNIRLRWGPNDYEGTEHMINSTRYAMELQAAFVKNSIYNDDILEAAKKGNLLILSYLFMITPLDNPYLEPIISSLRYLKNPMSCICIEPIILSLLTPVFSRDYFTYVGSLTFPPCTEGVRWIVKPEPLMISCGQVKKFRKLHGYFGRIDTNTRPVQKVCNRDTFYYE